MMLWHDIFERNEPNCIHCELIMNSFESITGNCKEETFTNLNHK